MNKTSFLIVASIMTQLIAFSVMATEKQGLRWALEEEQELMSCVSTFKDNNREVQWDEIAQKLERTAFAAKNRYFVLNQKNKGKIGRLSDSPIDSTLLCQCIATATGQPNEKNGYWEKVARVFNSAESRQGSKKLEAVTLQKSFSQKKKKDKLSLLAEVCVQNPTAYQNFLAGSNAAATIMTSEYNKKVDNHNKGLPTGILLIKFEATISNLYKDNKEIINATILRIEDETKSAVIAIQRVNDFQERE